MKTSTVVEEVLESVDEAAAVVHTVAPGSKLDKVVGAVAKMTDKVKGLPLYIQLALAAATGGAATYAVLAKTAVASLMLSFL